jgi:hypothetical protein
MNTKKSAQHHRRVCGGRRRGAAMHLGVSKPLGMVSRPTLSVSAAMGAWYRKVREHDMEQGMGSPGIIVFKRSKPFSFYHNDLVLDGGREMLMVPTDLVILPSGFHGDLKVIRTCSGYCQPVHEPMDLETKLLEQRLQGVFGELTCVIWLASGFV